MTSKERKDNMYMVSRCELLDCKMYCFIAKTRTYKNGIDEKVQIYLLDLNKKQVLEN